MCILLVEDEFLIRLILAEQLAEAGFDLRTADNGEHAIALIEAGPDAFTLLVTDIHMPGALDGIEVARRLRERRPDIPVIYMTGRPDVLCGAGRLGSRDVLMPKPFAPSELVAAARRLLDEARGSGAG